MATGERDLDEGRADSAVAVPREPRLQDMPTRQSFVADLVGGSGVMSWPWRGGVAGGVDRRERV